ncbi:hypothetical protein SVIO_058500 [Streptomyces violaceusniger]|uniref:HTH luxR-type domain-containing protein n=1 Tax=Streptomyces violaceusniger TaxID=68280 RepID=A0A4D4L9C7_STRVO|nr:hypothetical protein SVIO_058500 [Streptomyces violaceusniger]
MDDGARRHAEPAEQPGPRGDRPAVQGPLTERETDVLNAVADGLTNAEIGRRLVIAEATVKTHLLRLFAKLDVNDRTRAVVVAMERGILERPQRAPPSVSQVSTWSACSFGGKIG